MTKERHGVFIAGGTGYLGQRLIERLLERDGEVRAMVRPGPPVALPASAHVSARGIVTEDTRRCMVPGAGDLGSNDHCTYVRRGKSMRGDM